MATVCRLCRKAFQDSDRDYESGTFPTSHWGCSSESVDGRFLVLVVQGEEEPVAYGRYHFQVAAQDRAFRMAWANYDRPGRTYEVRDLETGATVLTTPGLLERPTG